MRAELDELKQSPGVPARIPPNCAQPAIKASRRTCLPTSGHTNERASERTDEQAPAHTETNAQPTA
eukprot:5496653-Alexandrium_andersonii.AAC.1